MNVQLHPWSSARKLNCPVKESQCTILAMEGVKLAAYVHSDNLTTDPPQKELQQNIHSRTENFLFDYFRLITDNTILVISREAKDK
jgi:hypothetical protein